MTRGAARVMVNREAFRKAVEVHALGSLVVEMLLFCIMMP